MNKSMRNRLLLSALLMVAAIGQGIYAHYSAYFPGDIWATRFVQTFDSPFILNFMELLSWLFTGWPAVVLVFTLAAILWLSLGRLEAVILAIGGVISLLDNLIKLIVGRPRPAPDLIHIIIPALGQSFPSGHTFFASMLMGTLAYFVLEHRRFAPWRLAVAGLLSAVAVLVGISRVYLGAHWGSDVVGAFSFAASLLIAMTVLHDYIQARSQREV